MPEPKPFAIERLLPPVERPEVPITPPFTPTIPAPIPGVPSPEEAVPEAPTAQPPTTVSQSLPVSKTSALRVTIRPIINYSAPTDTLTVRVGLTVLRVNGSIVPFIRDYKVDAISILTDDIILTDGDLIAASAQVIDHSSGAESSSTYCSLYLIERRGDLLVQSLVQGFIDRYHSLSWPYLVSPSDLERGYALYTEPGPLFSLTLDVQPGYLFYPVAFSAECTNTHAINTSRLIIYGSSYLTDGPAYARSTDLLPGASRVIKASAGLSDPPTVGLDEIMRIAEVPIPVSTILVSGVPSPDIQMTNIRLWLKYVPAGIP